MEALTPGAAIQKEQALTVRASSIHDRMALLLKHTSGHPMGDVVVYESEHVYYKTEESSDECTEAWLFCRPEYEDTIHLLARNVVKQGEVISSSGPVVEHISIRQSDGKINAPLYPGLDYEQISLLLDFTEDTVAVIEAAS
jgi:hypothetical protein